MARELLAMSQETLEESAFLERLVKVILKSTHPDVSEAKKCVEEAIVWQIMEDEGAEPLVPDFYEPLASAVIARHLLTIYETL